MGIKSRRKGMSGEREFIAILNSNGLALERNLEQARDGGCDLVGLPQLAIEVKRHKVATQGEIKRWWSQAASQASAGQRAILAYREDRKKWKIMLELQDNGATLLATLDVDNFILFLKSLPQLRDRIS